MSRAPNASSPPLGASAQQRTPPPTLRGQPPIFSSYATVKLSGTVHSSASRL
jgi:hypothetical protein